MPLLVVTHDAFIEAEQQEVDRHSCSMLTCLFSVRADEKEEGILGSILLPSFHISMLSVDDHINRKYAFKVSVCFHLQAKRSFTARSSGSALGPHRDRV